MANNSGIYKVDIDPSKFAWSKISSSAYDAAHGNFLNESAIIKDYWVDQNGQLTFEKWDDNVWLISKDGIAMGFTDDAGFNQIYTGSVQSKQNADQANIAAQIKNFIAQNGNGTHMTKDINGYEADIIVENNLMSISYSVDGNKSMNLVYDAEGNLVAQIEDEKGSGWKRNAELTEFLISYIGYSPQQVQEFRANHNQSGICDFAGRSATTQISEDSTILQLNTTDNHQITLKYDLDGKLIDYKVLDSNGLEQYVVGSMAGISAVNTASTTNNPSTSATEWSDFRQQHTLNNGDTGAQAAATPTANITSPATEWSDFRQQNTLNNGYTGTQATTPTANITSPATEWSEFRQQNTLNNGYTGTQATTPTSQNTTSATEWSDFRQQHTLNNGDTGTSQTTTSSTRTGSLSSGALNNASSTMNTTSIR